MGTLDDIGHFVVLMLENRSFDNLLGRLRPSGPDFDGLRGDESNRDAAGDPVAVWSGTGAQDSWLPDPDPGELFSDINEQLFGVPDPAPGAVADMSGFVRNYTRPGIGGAARTIMHGFDPAQVPALATLARSFAVSDRWFTAAPCQTWPNRFFVHTGTAGGHENNGPPQFPYLMPTIFNALGQAGVDWRIYFHDFPQALTLTRLWPHLDRFRPVQSFWDDAQQGTLPAYSFLEPRYFAGPGCWPNDMHPPHNVAHGDALVAQVYTALRNSPCWRSTLLLITFDEHGGCYDHVPPPPAPVPEPPRAGQAFAFDRFGVRVPAVVVSPWVAPGTVFRAPPGQQPFDHTAVIATLRERFATGAPLTGRDARAPTLAGVLGLDAPTNDGPAPGVSAAPLPGADDAAALQAAAAAPLNGFQAALRDAAAFLQPLVEGTSVDAHVRNLQAGQLPEALEARTVGEALPLLRGLVDRLLP